MCGLYLTLIPASARALGRGVGQAGRQAAARSDLTFEKTTP